MSTTTSADHFHLFTSESVSEGHPDKLADRISDRFLDAFLERDPHSRVACETMLATQCFIEAGDFKKMGNHEAKCVLSGCAYFGLALKFAVAKNRPSIINLDR
ncbi:S-adenosylmethionine synthase [anaerobic digester metagenome]